MRRENDVLKTDIDAMKDENKQLNTKVVTIKNENKQLKTEVQQLKVSQQLGITCAQPPTNINYTIVI